MNTLYYGDNLKILRDYIKDETIDLIYLDPPFNSNRNYNVLFKDESGAEAPSQIQAFEDTWHWHTGETAANYHELLLAGDEVSQMIESFHSFIGNNQMMAYLVMMAIRLKELHRVLKPTGSLYLHCDPTASHYLKILLDTIFSPKYFGNELVWQRTNAKGLAFTRFANNHDILFRYTKSEKHTWNAQYTPHSEEYLRKFYRFTEEGTGRRYRLADLTNPNKNRPNLTYEFLGVTRVWRWTRERMEKAYRDGLIVQSKEGGVPALKRYLDEQEGNPVGDVWTDLLPVQSQSSEILGYPTQKPVALLERIISASSNEGDVVLDPFCGCGTTIAAAQKLNRQWIGIDITHLSIALQKYRLKDSFDLIEKRDYAVIGEPEDLEGARQLVSEDRYQFQWWALSLIKARPLGGNTTDKTGKKGADKGIDGTITFLDEVGGKAKRVIVSVKSGHPNVSHIRDLGHVIDRENASIGVYLTLEPPTKPMLVEAAEKGFYHSPGWNKDYPRMQILTVEDLLNGKEIDMPPSLNTFKQAEKISSDSADQGMLGFH